MAVNRVDFGGNTLIDLTGDTLESAEQLLKGIIAHAKDGSVITGLMEAGGGGGGNIVLGEITFTSNENVTLTDAIPVRSQAPKAYFWFEKGLDFSNTTHTKPRPLAFIAARIDGGTASDTEGSYVSAYVRTSSGSNNYSGGTVNASNLFNRTSAATTDIYKIFSGNYKKGKLYFGVNNASGGFIEGRTYVWGVFPWDE